MEQNKPLSGIKVLELSTYVAAPITGRLMADLGAEVIKVEAAAGDSWRAFGETIGELACETENPLFDVYNAGKEGIVINLKDEEGMEAFHKLLAQADIFLTNTRGKSLKKMGLDYDTLKEKYPRLVYATVTGFGELGPDAASPGFDNVAFWTKTGFLTDMSITSPGSYPVGTPTGVGDSVCGFALLSNILAALFQRERTGKGDYVTISLYNTGIWVMGSMVIRTQDRYNDSYPKTREQMNPISTSYQCSDGEWIVITILDYTKYAETFFNAIGLPQLYTDPRYHGLQNMRRHGEELVPQIEAAIRQRSSQEWLELLKSLDIVCDRMTHFNDVSKAEQAWANEYVQEYTCRNGEQCVLPCPPLRLASMGNVKSGPAPLVGEHTQQVFARMGYSDQDIQRLADKGAIKVR